MKWRQSPQEMTRDLDPNIGMCMCPAEVHTVLSGHTPTQAQGLPLAGMSLPDSLSFPMFSNRTQPTLCSLPTSTQQGIYDLNNNSSSKVEVTGFGKTRDNPNSIHGLIHHKDNKKKKQKRINHIILDAFKTKF